MLPFVNEVNFVSFLLYVNQQYLSVEKISYSEALFKVCFCDHRLNVSIFRKKHLSHQIVNLFRAFKDLFAKMERVVPIWAVRSFFLIQTNLEHCTLIHLQHPAGVAGVQLFLAHWGIQHLPFFRYHNVGETGFEQSYMYREACHLNDSTPRCITFFSKSNTWTIASTWSTTWAFI